ncbi:expressed unknown protein [Seminavis robusta]|uniref:Uncharacterized protein n=1 Tax=Seminavis robusta TaxID=568900 RepID=A0A9N8EPD9_9STRA|nr:expressed unknown protein [Seminavis robusta]|eukprot:Sro1530_g280050.1 n/a (120) ;mRNA; f:3167-3526
MTNSRTCLLHRRTFRHLGYRLVFFFFLVEFWVRYGLDPAIGRRVFDLLKPKIEEIKTSLAPKTTQADIEPYQNLERETWEYTAREFLHEFRFDTVVAADRFGNILQYVQSQYLEDKKSA